MLEVSHVFYSSIIDGDLKKLRNKRWETAFDDTPIEEPTSTTVNRKATIVVSLEFVRWSVSHSSTHAIDQSSWST